MDDDELGRCFEDHRARLKAIAYRMTGSLADADDAVQEAWVRLQRTGADDIDNLGGWLTTVVARLCLNLLRSRATRRQDPLTAGLPDPLVGPEDAPHPEREAELAESVGLALQVVIDTLPAAERLAFVLHDMFGVPFDEIAELSGRSPAAARQLASRGRRRVRDAGPARPDPDLGRQRAVVDAFFAAARRGEFETLVSLLDDEVLLRVDTGTGGRRALRTVRGARAVAGQALQGANPAAALHPVLVNGSAGVLVTLRGRPYAVMGFVVATDRIQEVDVVTGARLRAIAATLPAV